MKTNLTELREVFKDHLESKKPASRESCPSPEHLLSLVRSKMSGGEREKILNHTIECVYCLDEIKTLLEITDKANAFVLDLQRFVEATDGKKGGNAGRLTRYLSWNYVSVASLVILFTAIAAYSVFRFSSRPSYRGAAVPAVELVSPVNKAVSGTGLKFIWKGLPMAKHYLVEVFDPTLDLVWRSESIAKNELSPPDEIVRGLKPGERYHWTVTAVLENGDSVKSRMKPFFVKK